MVNANGLIKHKYKGLIFLVLTPKTLCKNYMNNNYRGSEFSSYEIDLQNRVTQNDVTLWVKK